MLLNSSGLAGCLLVLVGSDATTSLVSRFACKVALYSPCEQQIVGFAPKLGWKVGCYLGGSCYSCPCLG